MKMRIDILSLFPEYFSGPFDESILKKAQEKGLIDIHLHNIRDYAEGNYKRVDDRPYGGGPGMVMMAPPLAKALRSVLKPESWVVYMSPQGKPLKAKRCQELSEKKHLVILCGHYEGVDERIISSFVDEEISIGDYVLSNGCLAAIVVVDAVTRFIPGVLGHELSSKEDSFQDGALDWPHYTRPPVFEGQEVPEVLLSGHHEKIQHWREEQALIKTQLMRPDLLGEVES
jgi:tRNA (guanine37-N1)-methyltransferase